MTPEDPRVEPPEPPPQPKTTELPALSDRALLEGLVRDMRDVKGSVASVVDDGRTTNLRLASIEGRVAILEAAPAIPSGPPPGITSMRVREVIEGHPSQMDLEEQAKLAGVIVWQKGVDDALAKAATKEDLKATTAAQTQALIDELKKNPVVQKVIYAVGGAVLAYLASKGIHIL